MNAAEAYQLAIDKIESDKQEELLKQNVIKLQIDELREVYQSIENLAKNGKFRLITSHGLFEETLFELRRNGFTTTRNSSSHTISWNFHNESLITNKDE